MLEVQPCNRVRGSIEENNAKSMSLSLVNLQARWWRYLCEETHFFMAHCGSPDVHNSPTLGKEHKKLISISMTFAGQRIKQLKGGGDDVLGWHALKRKLLEKFERQKSSNISRYTVKGRRLDDGAVDDYTDVFLWLRVGYELSYRLTKAQHRMTLWICS